MEKDEIIALFMETRPDENADPLKRFEFGYLEYSRSAVESYVGNVLGKQNFSIEILPSDKITDNRDFDAYWLEEKQCVQIFFKNRKGERCNERISIAESLGLIVLSFIPEQSNKDNLLFDVGYPSIAYFAQKLLELSAQRDNGSFLRRKYSLHTDDIANKIREFHNFDYVQLLEESHRNQIDTEINRIFTTFHTQDLVDGLLRSDIKLVTQYIQQKEPYSADSVQPLSIYTHANQETVSIAGKLYCHKTGCNIWYPAVERINDIRLFDRAPEINPLSAIRLIIAHEIGHIVCHRIPGFIGPIGGPKPSSPEEEREATYFARLLLERRELLYNNMIEDEDYDKACLEIKQLISQIYNGHNEEWMDWVLIDDIMHPIGV